MKKTDVLVIGGSAAGLVTAVTGKTAYPDKDFLVVRKEKEVMIPCGIPYIFGTLENSKQNILPGDTMYDKLGIKHEIGEVSDIYRHKKICLTKDSQEIHYDKLVLATGSLPNRSKLWNEKKFNNVHVIPKNKEYLDVLAKQLNGGKKIIIIGGGFIGVEIADELNKRGNDVTIVEILPHILTLSFDEEFAIEAEEILISRGVKVEKGVLVKEIIGEGSKANGVLLNDDTIMKADNIILSMGYHPNSSLGESAGIKIDEDGFIEVDEYMRTNDPDILAVGDCAEKRDFVTRKPTGLMLASTACAEGRTAGLNLFKLCALKTFNGTIAITSTAIGDHGFGTAGLTEAKARKEGFDITIGSFSGMDRHPGKLPGMIHQTVKLIVSRDSGIIIGGETIGGKSVGELINLIGFIIQSKTNVHSLLTAQFGTQPMLTASPAAYPLVKAAEVVSRKLYFKKNGDN